MKILVSPHVKRKFQKLRKRNKKLADKLDRSLEIFFKDPTHPSLRLHKLSSIKHEEWSISVTADVRILFQYIEGGIYSRYRNP